MQKLSNFSEGIIGSDAIWFAALGPGIKAQGEVSSTHEYQQKQVAATALKLLGEDVEMFNPNAGVFLDVVFE